MHSTYKKFKTILIEMNSLGIIIYTVYLFIYILIFINYGFIF